MGPIERILVPTDFSENARDAFSHAHALARRWSARIDLVHVHAPAQQVLTPYGLALPADVAAAIRDVAARKLAKSLEMIACDGVGAEMHLVEGPPAAAICAFAQSHSSDLIVMSTRGLTGLKHVLLGSVAERTVQRAPCPVMTVRAPRRPLEPVQFGRILVPMDFSTASHRALDLAQHLGASTGPGRVILLHAYEVPELARRYLGRAGRHSLGDPSTRILEDLEVAARPLARAGVPASFELRVGRPESLILEVARDQTVDLIVMGTHGRQGLAHVLLGSVAERVVRSSPCPTVTVKP